MNASAISETRIHEIMIDSMFVPEEMPPEGVLPEGTVLVDGISAQFGFHPQRLESHRAEVSAMLDELPASFHAFRDPFIDVRVGEEPPTTGGGDSFLNACMTKDGEQWTGLHRAVEALVVLGIGLGLVQYLMPREMWMILPGGMPYFMVKVAGGGRV